MCKIWSPVNSNKLSLKHTKAIQTSRYKTTFSHQNQNQRNQFIILNILDTNTGYWERFIIESRCADVMMSKFEKYWICTHGCPEYFRADPEFYQPNFTKYLVCHNVKLSKSPTRSSQKHCRVTRIKITWKSVFEKLSKENTKTDISLIVLKASFLTNTIFSTMKPTSFQFVLVYMPPAAGLPEKILAKYLLNAHIHMTSCRAIQKASNNRLPNNVPSSMVNTWYTIHVLYKRTNTSVEIA